MIKRTITASLLIFSIMLLIASCNNPPENVSNVLQSAKHNRGELEKVIDYYRQSGNDEKLQAAYFLIGHMKDKFWWDGEHVRNFNDLFFILDSLWHKRDDVHFMTSYIQSTWDSLARLYGKPSVSKAEKRLHTLYLKADYLIDNINRAFAVRDSLPWCKELAFENFCEYILPHCVGTEWPENWREHLSNEWKTMRDTIASPDRKKLTRTINNQNALTMHHLKIFWSFPFDMSASQMEMARIGSCKHTVYYTAMTMRANGLPVGVDYVPRWAGSSKGHEWNVLLLEDGSFYPFDAVNDKFTLNLTTRKIGKVFRETYAKQPMEISNTDTDIPREFFAPYRKDVTHEYVKAYDVTVPLKSFGKEKKHAIICSFDNIRWVPQYWGKIDGGKATFKNMGSDVIYSAMYYDADSLHYATEPFLLDTLGQTHFLNPDEQHRDDMRLTRKYPRTSTIKEVMGFIVGCSFQGANRKDFADSTTLYKITTVPEKFERVSATNNHKFRFVRMFIPKGGRGDMAEMEFYGLSDNGKDTIKLEGKMIGFPEHEAATNEFYPKPFDGDLLTYFLKPRVEFAWVGLDFGKPKRIVKIRYCPRSDANFIEAGHTYELCYRKESQWVSMGKKVATGDDVFYKDVPSKALYILHDHTKGTEERIFTYEQGKQIWW